jgi:hypothetical protein
VERKATGVILGISRFRTEAAQLEYSLPKNLSPEEGASPVTILWATGSSGLMPKFCNEFDSGISIFPAYLAVFAT